MNDTDKVKMTINIGGEHMELSVPFNRQDVVRDAEKAVATLIDSWRLKWPKHSDTRILAMAAYQFASLYQDLLERHEKAAGAAEKALRALDDIIAADNA